MIDLKLIQELTVYSGGGQLAAVHSMDGNSHVAAVTQGHWLTRSGSTTPCFWRWLCCIAVYSTECFELLIRTSRFHRQELGTRGSKGIHCLSYARNLCTWLKGEPAQGVMQGQCTARGDPRICQGASGSLEFKLHHGRETRSSCALHEKTKFK